MTESEIMLFSELLENATSYLEFGSGGSTLFALNKLGLRTIYSIDTDSGMIAQMKANPAVASAIRKGRLRMEHVDVGPVGGWGWPVSIEGNPLLDNYLFGIWGKLPETVDMILIDGRFRVYTALKALLMYKDSTFLFHDFTSRSHYSVILPWIDVSAVVDSMIAYKRRDGANRRKLLLVLDKATHDVR